MQIMCRAKTNITHTKNEINTCPIIPSKKPKLTLCLDFDDGCFPLFSLRFSPDAYDGGIIYCNFMRWPKHMKKISQLKNELVLVPN